MIVLVMEIVFVLNVFVKWVGLDSTVLLKVAPKIVLHMVDVLMVFVIVLLDLWEKHANKKCVQMVALVMVVAMVLQEDVNVMLVMVVLIVHNQFAQIVLMENVVMMQLVYVKLDSLVQLVLKKNVKVHALQMVENVTMEIVYALQELLDFNVRHLLKFVLVVAVVMVFVMKLLNNVIVMKDSVELIVVLKDAQTDVTNQTENALMEHVSVHQTSVVLIVVQRIAQITAFLMENVMLNHILATVNLDGLVMIVV
jgi:hypothetical protein